MPILERVLKLIYVLGAITAGAIMIAMFVAAFWEIATAVLIFFHAIPPHDPQSAADSDAITVALKGIEYLFLAPMSFLVYRCLALYVVEKAGGSKGGDAEGEVTQAKTLATTLMIAVVATDLVERVLSPAGLAQSRPIYELALIAVLAGYYALLRILAKIPH